MVLEAFTVTGSNIRRVDQENSLPVTIVTAEDVLARDAATPMDLLSAIPYITDIPENETPTNGIAGRGDNANIALRGLGAGNTLVLLNGRRYEGEPGSADYKLYEFQRYAMRHGVDAARQSGCDNIIGAR